MIVLIVALWILVGLNVLAIFINPFAIGLPREPITPAGVVGRSVMGTILIIIYALSAILLQNQL